MSASSKKKLRKEQAAAKMTEKQLAEQKEAKKLTLMTRLFVAVLAVIVVVAAFIGTTRFISNSRIREKNTVALTVDSHEISNAEMNYFFIDAVNNFTQQYGSYISLFGLDTTKPLDEQIVNEEAGTTWADDFLSQATETAKSIYAMYDAAVAAGHTLTDAEKAAMDATLSNMKAYALLYGYEDAESYLKAMYGSGTTEESFRKKLKGRLSSFAKRRGWKYIGVWERSPKTSRLHFHGIFHIPEGTLPGILLTHKDYSTTAHKMQTRNQSTYFNDEFGRSDFEPINDNRRMGEAMAYLMKYLEKTGEKIIYSKGLPQYFISDILDDDIVCTVGQEEKKLLLFDDFNCFDEGCYVGEVSPAVIAELRKSN